jgi:hypothetical protein
MKGNKQIEMLNDVIRSGISTIPYYNKEKVLNYLENSYLLSADNRAALADVSFTLMSLASIVELQNAYKLTF